MRSTLFSFASFLLSLPFWQPCRGLHSNACVPPPSAFSSLHSSCCRSASPLLRSTSLNWRRGRRRRCFSLSLIFEIATKLGTSPWCRGVKEGAKTTCSLSLLPMAHSPSAYSVCGVARGSKWVQALRSVKCRFFSQHICVSRYTPSC